MTRRQLLGALATTAVFGACPRVLRATAPATEFPFERIPASASGISWIHVNGRSPEKYLPETTGAGCAFLDYDNDGWMDIYLVNSGKCDFFTPDPPLRNALYRNNGDGTFTDVTEKAGVAAPGWSSSAVWFDYDNDGKLDLFVCRFADFDKSKHVFCGNERTGKRYNCSPRSYPSAPGWLFPTMGDGTFKDVSVESAIGKSMGKAWGVVATDIDNDGWVDLFVANDTVPNFLFLNKKNGTFAEIGLESGVAFSQDGRERGGMGVDSADFDQDGWQDLFVANVDQEMYSIYRNNHDLTFDDMAGPLGIGRTTRLMSGWGVKFFDYDNDGNLDLFLANGHPDDKIESHSSHVKYLEPLLLFHSSGKRFEDVSSIAGPAFAESLAARGLAIGDFNNDGAVDALVSVNGGAPLLLKNCAAAANHWLGLRLVGKKANPDAIGARITWQAGDLRRSRLKVGGGSYLSSHDPREVLGIGPRTKIDRLDIQWPQPSGKTQTFRDLAVDRYVTIVEGADPLTP